MKLINSNLNESKQRVKINDQFSSLLDIVVRATQGSALIKQLLFHLFLCDMFPFCNGIDFGSYADGNTIYCIGKTPDEVITQKSESPKNPFLNVLNITE